MTELELLTEYAKAWNNLDVSCIEPFLADDFLYESQWVYMPMKGKKAYIEYLEAKFNAIRKSNTAPVVELAYFEIAYGERNKPCILLVQNTPSGTNKSTIMIETGNDKIKRADMVFIPPPESAITYGIVPK